MTGRADNRLDPRRSHRGRGAVLVLALAACSTAGPATTSASNPQAANDRPTYSDSVLDSQPVARWPLEGAEPGEHGEYRGNVALGQDPAVSEGSSVYLDGDTGHIWVGGASQETAQSLALDEMTIELWFKAESLPNDRAMHVARWRWHGWGIYISDGRLAVEIWEDVATAASPPDPAIRTLEGPELTDNRWYHVALTRTVDTTSLYIDGRLETEIPSRGRMYYLAVDPEDDCCGTGGGVAFGRDADVDGNYLRGWLDEIAIYPSALSADVIAAHSSYAGD